MPEETTENNGATPAPENETQENSAPSQKIVRDEKEKAAFTLKKNAERLKELGGDPDEVLGRKPQFQIDETLHDDEPLTVGKFREIQKQDSFKTALQMAEELPEDERDEVKRLLTDRIKPSGNAEEDLRLARAAANASRNTKIVEEATRRTAPKMTAAGGSSPALVEDTFTPTAEEAIMMRPPYNVPKEKIIAARKRAE